MATVKICQICVTKELDRTQELLLRSELTNKSLAKELAETKQLLAHKNDTANTFMAQVKRLQEELAESKRTNERLVQLLREGMKVECLNDSIAWDREVIAEFRHLGLNV